MPGRPPWEDARPPWEPQPPEKPKPAPGPPWEPAVPPGQVSGPSFEAAPRPSGMAGQRGQPARPQSRPWESPPASGQGARLPQRGGPQREASRLRLIWVYPDLLSTYGDRGNLLVLERRARLRGLAADSVIVTADQPVPRQGDIYLMGGGEDLPQILAARRLRADGGLAAAARQGAVVFAVCAGYQLLGAEFGGDDGQPLPGLEILDIRSGRGKRRGVGEILADPDPALGVARLTGFENHQGVTTLGPSVTPLATVVTGVGNGDGTEGAYAGHVLGTYLHGPALVRNPDLADLLLFWAAGPLPPLAARDEEWTKKLREQRLAAVPAASG